MVSPEQFMKVNHFESALRPNHQRSVPYDSAGIIPLNRVYLPKQVDTEDGQVLPPNVTKCYACICVTKCLTLFPFHSHNRFKCCWGHCIFPRTFKNKSLCKIWGQTKCILGNSKNRESGHGKQIVLDNDD